MAQPIAKSGYPEELPRRMDCVFFRTNAGKAPAEKVLKGRDALRDRLIARMVTHCEEYDAGQFQPDGKKVKPFPGAQFDGEIRVRHKGQAYRFSYSIDKERRLFVLLDGFQKESGKSERWPPHDVKRSEKRWRQFKLAPEKHGAPS